jgi:inosose dehydratase
MHRRAFFSCLGLVGAAGLTGRSSIAARSRRLHIASNEYSWSVFYSRENRNFKEQLDQGLADLVKGDLDGLEPLVESLPDLERLLPLLQKHGLQMRSLYVNSTLHEADQVDASLDLILQIAKKARPAGTRIIVTNPSPIRWGGSEAKDDRQLRTQAAALNALGRELTRLDITLAYHNHDIELKNGAREFHHMMVGTAPKLVSLCLDSHWIYRGTDNSSVALFDIVELYGHRVVELHLRQSQDQVWSESLRDGDIDYRALASKLREKRVKPHLVTEIAVEKGTPRTMDPVTAHRVSAEFARKVFAGFEN